MGEHLYLTQRLNPKNCYKKKNKTGLVYREVMAMKEYSSLPKASGLKPPNKIKFRIITWTFIDRGVTPLQRCSRRFRLPT